jgi:hypothetical protein
MRSTWTKILYIQRKMKIMCLMYRIQGFYQRKGQITLIHIFERLSAKWVDTQIYAHILSPFRKYILYSRLALRLWKIE